ncbi:MAG: SIS domain-containing protein [Oscillospiraceae bacterium]|nr:SIS domain-containing protein [Oscillospiraceae bacterium]
MTDHELLSEVKRTIQEEAEALQKLAERIDDPTVLRAADALLNCKGKVILTGCGTSGMSAKKIAHTLSCIEIPALYMSPADAVHGDLGVLQKDDILILISKGGNTVELLPLIPACKTKQAMLIAVSENPSSEIARNADIYLEVKVDREPCRFNMLATASTLAVISLFDGLCIAMMQKKGYTRDQFAVIHPHGAVGERLLHHLD